MPLCDRPRARVQLSLVGLEAALICSVILVVRQYLMARDDRRAELGIALTAADMAWNASTTMVYPGISTFAGVIAGTFGVGGGMVKGPLMLAMGVHPSAATATSATMIMFTSLTAVVVYVIMGTIKARRGAGAGSGDGWAGGGHAARQCFCLLIRFSPAEASGTSLLPPFSRWLAPFFLSARRLPVPRPLLLSSSTTPSPWLSLPVCPPSSGSTPWTTP